MKTQTFTFSAKGVAAVFLVLFSVVFVACECSSGSPKGRTPEYETADNGGHGNTGQNGGITSDADTGDSAADSDDAGDPACRKTLLEDDFSGDLATNWTVGTNPAINPGGPTVAIDDQEVAFSRSFDYLETKQEFTGDFQVQVAVNRSPSAGSTQPASYYVELVGLDGVAAIMRFRYGADAKDSINVGKPPVSGQVRGYDSIRSDRRYLKEIDHVGELAGLLTLTYHDGSVQVSWKNSEGTTIFTPPMPAGTFKSSKVRIWGLGGHRIERVRVCKIED